MPHKINGRRSALRQAAEKRVPKQRETPKLTDLAAKRLVHELQVHRVELEMQNDELRRSQIEATENSKKYGELYDFAPVALFTLSKEGVILEVNRAGVLLLNRPRKILLRSSFGRYLSGAFELHNLVAVLYDVVDQERTATCEVQMRPFGKQPVLLELQCAPVNNSVRVAATDITELRKNALEREKLLEEARAARTSAELASHAKDDFLALISHELRTPLMAMRGWTSILRRHKLARDAELKGLETIERNIAAQDRLIEDLLDVSSITTGKLKLDFREIELATIVNEVVEAHRPTAAAKKLILELHSPAEPQFLRGDELRIKQIVSNLLTNSIKFTPAEGRISVTLKREGDHATLVISDNGIGIALKTLPHVFDRFRQEEPATSRQSKGLGLGLNIVRFLTEAHGGNVQAQSEGRGQGATFTVNLPLVPAHPAAQSGPKELLAPPEKIEGVHLLVVEDDADTREYLQKVLVESGAKVDVAESVIEALEKMRASLPDVVLTDIGLPIYDGHQFLQMIRKHFADRGDLPVIGMSAFPSGEKQDKAGFSDFLKKPFEAAQLIAAIKKVLPVPNPK
jgi:signal transduction histidine kinase